MIFKQEVPECVAYRLEHQDDLGFDPKNVTFDGVRRSEIGRIGERFRKQSPPGTITQAFLVVNGLPKLDQINSIGGGSAAVQNSSDPMIGLARIEPWLFRPHRSAGLPWRLPTSG